MGIAFYCAVMICGGFGVPTEDQYENTNSFGQLRNYQADIASGPVANFELQWQKEVGEGRSQIVGDKEFVFVASGYDGKESDQVSIHTSIRCYRAENGEQIWEWKEKSIRHKKQENFSGAPCSPQSTPLLLGDRIIATTFDGLMVCLNTRDGNLIWKKDLVRDLAADPVQFGFSSSPVGDQVDPGRVYVQAQSETGGLYCLNVSDGSTIWKADSSSFSYSTPVQAAFGKIDQLVVVSRTEVAGIEKKSGEKLWSYKLPEQGLTNVPTPLVIDQQSLLVAGQGTQGTRCVRVTRDGDRFLVEEKWYERKLNFFYSNWAKLTDGKVIGCLENFLVLFDSKTGEIEGRWRGFSNSNLLLTNREVLVIDGKGTLHRLSHENDKWETGLKTKLLDARCWTPLSVIEGRIFVRGGKSLACLNVNGNKNPLPNLLTTPKLLKTRSESN